MEEKIHRKKVIFFEYYRSFQHLSNEDIYLIIKNLFPNFKYIIITEQQIKDELLIKKNLNKPSGLGTKN